MQLDVRPIPYQIFISIIFFAAFSGCLELEEAPSDPTQLRLSTLNQDDNPLLPKAPSNLDFEITALGDVLLQWSDQSDNETSFIIYRRDTRGEPQFEKIAEVNANQTEYEDDIPERTTGWEYDYIIVAKNDIGLSNPSSAITVFVPPIVIEIPEAPSNLLLSIVSTTGDVELRWTDNSSNETEFRIYRADTRGSPYTFERILTLPANTSMIINDVPARPTTNWEYDYYVTAANSAGESDPTEIETILVPAFPATQ